MPTETLYCTVGDHIWVEDVPQGATKPTVCPYCASKAVPKAPKPSKAKVGKVDKAGEVEAPPKPRQTLYCEIGEHEWQREPQRGKRPKNCPEHRPQPQRASGGSSGVQRSTAAKGRPNVLTLAEIQERYPKVDPESARIFAFCEQEALVKPWPGWREQGDISLLIQAYNQRLVMVARAHGRVTNLTDLKI